MPRTQAEVMREVADQVLPGTCISQVSGYSIQHMEGGSKLMGIVVTVALKHPQNRISFGLPMLRPSNTLRPSPKFGRQIDIPLPLHGTKGMGMEGFY